MKKRRYFSLEFYLRYNAPDSVSIEPLTKERVEKLLRSLEFKPDNSMIGLEVWTKNGPFTLKGFGKKIEVPDGSILCACSKALTKTEELKIVPKKKKGVIAKSRPRLR